MNIFVVNEDPEQSARDLCDQHVHKMTLETAQLLCCAFPVGDAPYLRSAGHGNHPCAKWVRESSENFNWLVAHGLTLAEEFEHRYGKPHASGRVILWAWEHRAASEVVTQCSMTPFVQAMPDEFKRASAVDAYRAYYIGSKVRFAKWSRTRPPPAWWQV